MLDAAAIYGDYVVTPDIVYMAADGYESKLDVHRPRASGAARPTIVFIHGGGWVGGSKEGFEGANSRGYGVRWFAGVENKAVLAKRESPLSYVRPGLPPIITIHADADPTGPYAQATRLRDALTKAGVTNELVTIPGGGHGNFVAPQRDRAWITIRAFLEKLSIPTQLPTAGQ